MSCISRARNVSTPQVNAMEGPNFVCVDRNFCKKTGNSLRVVVDYAQCQHLLHEIGSVDVSASVDGLLHVHERADRGALNGLLVRGELVEERCCFSFWFSSLVHEGLHDVSVKIAVDLGVLLRDLVIEVDVLVHDALEVLGETVLDGLEPHVRARLALVRNDFDVDLLAGLGLLLTGACRL